MMIPTYAEIKLNNLIHNYKSIRKRTNKKIMAVVKADAYGHGMLECVKSLSSLKEKPEYYGVALEREALELAESNFIDVPILCFAPFQKTLINTYLRKKIMPTVTSPNQIREIKNLNFRGKLKLHVNINTGMNRLGINHDESVRFIKDLVKTGKVKIDGIYTHFATSDEKDKEYADLQLERFKIVLTKLKKNNIDFGIAHAANSGAILDMPGAYFDMVRPGISLYGYYPSLDTSASLSLKPVMNLYSKLSTVFPLSKGESVGYGRIFSTDKKILCGSIPAGYADGISRALSNKMRVIIGDKLYNQVGRVSMDRININLGSDKKRIDSMVILLGKTKNCKIDAWDWSKLLGTIPYEITCNISKRVPRIYV